MKTRASVVVATPNVAEEIGRRVFSHAPHFHCGGVDAGTVAELYHLLTGVPKPGSAMRMVYSKSTQSKSVHVFLLASFVVERFAEIAESDVHAVGARWAQAPRDIRLPRSADYYRDLIYSINRLARLALRTEQGLLLRVEYGGPYNLLQQPTPASGRG